MGHLSLSILLFLATWMVVFSGAVTAHLGGGHHRMGGLGGHHRSGGGSGNAVLGGLCSHTDFPAICNAVVKPGIVGGASATSAAINAAILQTSQAKSMALKLIPGTVNTYRKSSLQVCVQNYDDAISNLVTSIQNVKARSIATLKINLSAAISDYVACDEGFQELPGGISPLNNDLLRKFVSNCLALADFIH